MDVITTYEDAFTHNKKTDCPVSSCLIGTLGNCASAPSSTNLILDTNSPYKVTAKQNIQAGYTQDFCYSCVVKPADGNPGQYRVVNNNLKVKANVDCSGSMSKKTITLSAFAYNLGGTGKVMI